MKTLLSIYRWPERALSVFFEKQGRIIAIHPWKFIFLPSLLFMIMCGGLFCLRMEDDVDVWSIYYPINEPITMSTHKLRRDFSTHSASEYHQYQDTGEYLSISFVVTPTSSLVNLTDAPALREIQILCKYFEEIVVDGSVYGDVCAKRQYDYLFGLDGPDCVKPEICRQLRERDFEEQAWLDSRALVMDGSLPPSHTVDGKQLLTYTLAVRGTWFFMKDTKQQKLASVKFLRGAFDQLFSFKSTLKNINVDLFSLTVQLDELGKIVENDSPLFGVTVVLMAIFSILVSAHRDFLKSRAFLAVGGVVTTCLSIGTGIGFMGYLRVPFIQVTFLTPFIMLGIGIDSSFVLMFTWAKQDHELLSTEECIGATLGTTFVSIFISNMTAFLAFLVGSFTPFEAVNITCYYLSSCVISLLLFEGTFFTAWLSIHHRRIKITQGRLQEYLSCQFEHQASTCDQHLSDEAQTISNLSHHPKQNFAEDNVVSTQTVTYETEVAENFDDNEHQPHDVTPTKSNSGKALNTFTPQLLGPCRFCGSQERMKIEEAKRLKKIRRAERRRKNAKKMNHFERFIRTYLPKVVLNEYCRLIVIFGTGICLKISLDGAIKMKEYITEIGFQPDNSRITEYYYKLHDYYNDSVTVHFVITEKLDYWDANVYSAFQMLRSNFSASEFVDSEKMKRIPFWLDYVVSFGKSLSTFENLPSYTEKEAVFYEETDKTLMFVPAIKNDVIFDKNNRIVQSRFFIALNPLDSNSVSTKECIKNLRKIQQNFPYSSYIASINLMIWERNSLMKSSIWYSIILALISCSAVTGLLLPHPTVFLCVLFSAATTMVMTLGFMGLMGIHYNMGTYIIVLLLTGLCIDYMSHSGHSYLVERGETPREITVKALKNIGVPLFNAAMSSLLGILMLSLSSSLIMRRMFKCMTLLLSFSFFFGVVFLPIILSFVGPVRKAEDSAGEDTAKEKDAEEGNTQNQSCDKCAPEFFRALFCLPEREMEPDEEIPREQAAKSLVRSCPKFFRFGDASDEKRCFKEDCCPGTSAATKIIPSPSNCLNRDEEKISKKSNLKKMNSVPQNSPQKLVCGVSIENIKLAAVSLSNSTEFPVHFQQSPSRPVDSDCLPSNISSSDCNPSSDA